MRATINSLPRELVQRVFRASCTKSGRAAVVEEEYTELALSLRDRWGQPTARGGLRVLEWLAAGRNGPDQRA